MATMNISIPDKMKEYVESQLAESGYRSVDEYILHLLEEDKRRKAAGKLEERLVEGLTSGEPRPFTASVLADIRRQVEERVAESDASQ